MKVYGFGKLSDGRRAGIYILKNTNGMEASVTDYGAALVSLVVTDRNGKLRDVVLGHDDVAGYESGHGSIGGTVGRFANRIGEARFAIDDKTYALTANHGPNALHGGRDPYTKRLWKAVIPFAAMSSNDIARKYALESLNDRWPANVPENLGGDTVTFVLDSPDGDQGFPGNLHIEVTYTLTDENALHIDYKAVSDKDTALNLTNHSYFNLNGDDSGTVLDQYCEIKAELFTPNDKNSLPTGEVRSIAGTPMDFHKPKALGTDINKEYEQLAFGNGYDHNYVLTGADKADSQGLCDYRKVAVLYSEKSGIEMKVLTDLPGMQLYTANGMKGELGKRGVIYDPRCAVCFETQFWPDAVNHENFPGGIIKAGQEFHSRTTYQFSF